MAVLSVCGVTKYEAAASLGPRTRRSRGRRERAGARKEGARGVGVMHLQAAQRPLIWRLVPCWCDLACPWCIKASPAYRRHLSKVSSLGLSHLEQNWMGPRVSKMQADVMEGSMADSRFSIINLHTNSVASTWQWPNLHPFSADNKCEGCGPKIYIRTFLAETKNFHYWMAGF